MEQWQQGLSQEDAEALPMPLAFTVEPFADEDYEAAATWWTQHGWPVVPRGALPTLGITVSYEGRPVCVSFMYRDSGWGCIAWTVADQELPKATRRAAVDFAVEVLTAYGDSIGLAWLYTCTRNPAMQERYTRLGWVAAETDFQQFIRVNPTLKRS